MADKLIFSILVLKNCFTQFIGTNYPRELVTLIMKPMIDACFILKVNTSQTEAFKNVFSIMNDLIEHCCIKIIRQKGLYMSQTTTLNDKIIKFDLTNFDTCYCEESELYMGIDVGELNKQLNLLDSSHSIILYIRNDSKNILRIWSGLKEIEYSLHNAIKDPFIPKAEFKYSFTMNHEEFNTLYDKLNKISKFFTIDSNGIRSCDRYLMGRPTFELKSLLIVRQYKKLCSNITIRGGETFLLLIQMKAGSLGTMYFYIAGSIY